MKSNHNLSTHFLNHIVSNEDRVSGKSQGLRLEAKYGGMRRILLHKGSRHILLSKATFLFDRVAGWFTLPHACVTAW